MNSGGEEEEGESGASRGGYSTGDSDDDDSAADAATSSFVLPAWLGRQGWVVAGSDCGGAWVYCRATGIAVAVLEADADVCNAVRPHPTEPLLATSGIESTVKLWRGTGFRDGAALGGAGGEAEQPGSGTRRLRRRAARNQALEEAPVYDATYNPGRMNFGALLGLLQQEEGAEGGAQCPVQ